MLAAASVLGQFPGRWTVRQQVTNPAATAFWRKAIPYPFQEHQQGTEIVQSFTTGFMPACYPHGVSGRD